MKFANILNKKHKHNWKEVYNSIGRSNFQGIAGDVKNVRVKAVIEKCSECGEERAYLVDGTGTEYSISPDKIRSGK